MATIKINREQLIKTLTAKVNAMEMANKRYESAEAALKKERAAWGAKIIAHAIKHHKDYGGASHFYQPWNSHVRVEICVPLESCPPEPTMPDGLEWFSPSDIKELHQFIKLLHLGTDDSINMSALKNVQQYL